MSVPYACGWRARRLVATASSRLQLASLDSEGELGHRAMTVVDADALEGEQVIACLNATGQRRCRGVIARVAHNPLDLVGQVRAATPVGVGEMPDGSMNLGFEGGLRADDLCLGFLEGDSFLGSRRS